MVFDEQLTFGEDEPVTPIVRDPVIAAAISRCLVQEDFPSYHPGPCRYCAVDRKIKLDAVIEFNDWMESGPHPVVDAFTMLPHIEQRFLVNEHLGYECDEEGRCLSNQASGRSRRGRSS